MTTSSSEVFAEVVKQRDLLPSELYSKSGTYKVRNDLTGGKRMLSLIEKTIHQSDTTIPAVLDLMGEVTTPRPNPSGFTVNDMNTFWEEY